MADPLAGSSLNPEEPTSSLPLPGDKRHWSFATECATVENPSVALKDQHGSSSVPIYQTATFKGMDGAFDYTRSGNPTRSFLEHHLKKLSGAASAHVLNSGMTALDCILRLVKPGETVLAGDDIYGGSNRLLGWAGTDGGLDVRHVDTTNLDAVAAQLVPGQNKVTMVLLESPTNPLLRIVDIVGILKLVRAGAPDALVVLDNTMMSPYLQRPLDLGVDIVYDSATKYLSGHHDLMAGAITARTEEVGKRLAWFVNAMGTGLPPFDCFLLLRGLKTLSLRMDRQQANCNVLAAYLHTLGFPVHYPGLKTDPGHTLHFSQATGAGAVMSFETADVDLSSRIVAGTSIFGISVSFGAVNSLISMPCLMSHASIPAHLRAERGLPEHLIRLCIGIEDVHDLVDDLERSLLSSGAIRPRSSVDGSTTTTTPAANNDDWAVVRASKFERIPVGQLAKPESHEDNGEILVSAPGKVILFGEHAVVHGVTGLAASVDLRCFGLLEPNKSSSGSITLSIPDLSSTQTWASETLPWDLAPQWTEPPTELDQALLSRCEELAEVEGIDDRGRVSAAAFLYLLVILSKGVPSSGFTFVARSTLPMGAGLGSSAAYSTCLATAFLLHFLLIHPPALPPPSSTSHTHVSHSGRRALEQRTIEMVDKWAFVAEKVIHGTPSGIDNAVSVRGGAVAFRRKIEGLQEGSMEGIKSFSSVRFLITDSRIGRDTRTLVAGVHARLASEPAVIKALLEGIQTVADEAQRCLKDVEMPRADLIGGLGALIKENHALLVSLGVSHPKLEEIISLTAGKDFGLATKLTGAGGGGCAVTLLPDDFPPSSLSLLTSTLTKAGFAPYVTSVGGSGVGLLHPVSRTSTSSGEGGWRSVLEGLEGGEVEQWALGRGKWGFA